MKYMQNIIENLNACSISHEIYAKYRWKLERSFK